MKLLLAVFVRDALQSAEAQVLRLYGIGTLSGPLAKGAIYRRHGLFPYDLPVSVNGLKDLLAGAAPDVAEALLPPEDVVSHRLAQVFTPKQSWVHLVQLFAYRAERARPDRDKSAALIQRMRELKESHRGDIEIQARDTLGTTVH